MKAIVTKYHGPSAAKGSRMSARAEGKRAIITEYNDALNSDGNHEAACKALCAKNKWAGEMISGMLPDGNTVWVFVPDTFKRVDTITSQSALAYFKASNEAKAAREAATPCIECKQMKIHVRDAVYMCVNESCRKYGIKAAL